MAAFSVDLDLIDTDGSGAYTVAYNYIAKRITGGAVHTKDHIHILHNAVCAELFCTARKFFFGRLEDKFYSAFYQFFVCG